MGRNERERKLARLAREEQLKQAETARRRSRSVETQKLTRQLALVSLSTVVLLYIGVMVTSRLEEIVSRISHLAK
jgi:hypothetical protein